MKYTFIIVTSIVLFILSPLSWADHLLLNDLSVQVSSEDIDALFNGTAIERVDKSYELFKQGGLTPESLLAYWNRIYLSIENEDEFNTMLDEIRAINDLYICELADEMDMPVKPNNLMELCQ